MFRSHWRLCVVGAVLPLFLGSVCLACPTCKDGIAEGTQQAGMIRGYFWSILFMMSMPFVIFGGLGAYFYYQVRQARTTLASDTASDRLARSTISREYKHDAQASVLARE